MGEYAISRDPEVWSELRKSVLTTPDRANRKLNFKKVMDAAPTKRMLDDIGQVLTGDQNSEWGEYVGEAGDPFEIVGTVFAPRQGAKALKNLKDRYRGGPATPGEALNPAQDVSGQTYVPVAGPANLSPDVGNMVPAPELMTDEAFASRAASLEGRLETVNPSAAPDAVLFPDPNSNPDAPVEIIDAAILTEPPAAFDPTLPDGDPGPISPLVEAAPAGMEGEAESAPLISPPLTPATPADPAGMVTERPEDLAAQRERVAADRKPAMILPGVDPEQAAQVFPPAADEVWTATPEGAVLHKPAQLPAAQVEQEAAAGTIGNVLGYGMPTRPAQPTGALVHRDAQGRELAAVAVDESTYGQAYTALAAQAGPGDTIQPEDPVDTIQRRLAPAPANQASESSPLSNAQDPALSPDFTAGNLPNDVAALPPLPAGEADRRTMLVERSLRAEGALRPSDGLQLRDADQLSVGRPSLGFASALAGVFGRRVLIVRNKAGGRLPFNGMVNRDVRDTIFLDENSNKNPSVVTGHELIHHLEQSHKDLFNRFDDVVRPLLTNMGQARRNYAAYLKSPNPDLNVRREVYGDFLGGALHDPMFWSQLSRRQPGLFMPLARAVWNWFGKAVNSMRMKGWSSSQHFTDLLQARAYLADAVAEFAARENGIKPTPADQLFNQERTENFFSGRQDLNRATPEQVEARMAATVEQLRSAEDALQEGWNLTRSTEMERTRESDPIIPTANKIKPVPFGCIFGIGLYNTFSGGDFRPAALVFGLEGGA